MLLEFLVLVLVFVVSLVYYVNRRPPNYAPVPKLSFPVLGHFPYFQKYEKVGLHRMFMEWGKECESSIFGVDFGLNKSVVINDYKLIREAYNMPELSGRIISRGMSYRGGDEGVNRGLIWSDGNHSLEQRRFALRHLKEFGFGKHSMESVILIEAEELVCHLKKQSASGKPVSTMTLFNPAVVNTFCQICNYISGSRGNERGNNAVVNSFWQICAGERFSHDDQKLAEIVRNVLDTKMLGTIVFMECFCSLAPKLSGWTTYVEAFNVMNIYITKFVERRLKNHKPGSTQDFTDVYINEMLTTTNTSSSFFAEEGKKQLINSLGDIFVAGSETTTTTMSWLTLYMALHPEVQDKVHREIDSVIGRDRLPTLHDRLSMPYTEACILETLRLSSIAPISLFHRALENVTLNGIIIPRNTTVIANLYGVHHDPQIWGQNVNEFVPERFLSQNELEVIRHEQMLAFSCGKRKCLGESLARNELFLFTSVVLQNFSVEPDPNTPRPTMAQNCGGVVCGTYPHQLIFTQR